MQRSKQGVTERLALGRHQTAMEPGGPSPVAPMGLPNEISHRWRRFVNELPGDIANSGRSAEGGVKQKGKRGFARAVGSGE